MNVTSIQYERLKAVGRLLPCGKELQDLNRDDREIIYKYDQTMLELQDKRKRDNKRIASYIAEKRKDNKNYAR